MGFFGTKRVKRTAKQRSASKRNLIIARAARKRGTKKGFKAEYKEQRSHGMTKKISRNVAWGIINRR